jgi:hypothetical protein
MRAFRGSFTPPEPNLMHIVCIPSQMQAWCIASHFPHTHITRRFFFPEQVETARLIFELHPGLVLRTETLVRMLKMACLEHSFQASELIQSAIESGILVKGKNTDLMDAFVQAAECMHVNVFAAMALFLSKQDHFDVTTARDSKGRGLLHAMCMHDKAEALPALQEGMTTDTIKAMMESVDQKGRTPAHYGKRSEMCFTQYMRLGMRRVFYVKDKNGRVPMAQFGLMGYTIPAHDIPEAYDDGNDGLSSFLFSWEAAAVILLTFCTISPFLCLQKAELSTASRHMVAAHAHTPARVASTTTAALLDILFRSPCACHQKHRTIHARFSFPWKTCFFEHPTRLVHVRGCVQKVTTQICAPIATCGEATQG